MAFIPTKEAVFEDIAQEMYMRALLKSKAAAREEIQGYLQQRGVEVVDTLPALSDLVSRGINPYRQAVNKPCVDGDGHPVKEGYHQIAATIAAISSPARP